MSKLLFKAGDDWTPELIDRCWEEIEIIAREELKIDYYRPQIEIVSAQQMLNAYTSVGMPIYYRHWSFGKEFVTNEKAYRQGRMGLAYELVINSDPCIAYLMEENTMLTQLLVMAHASVGHSAVFKHNYLFKEYTDASAIIDYLAFARNYIAMCEEKYGEEEVESVLDACHAVQNYGVDKYRRPAKISAYKEEARAIKKFTQELEDYDHVWEQVGKQLKEKNTPISAKTKESRIKRFDEPYENILYFIEKNAPHLPVWKRELIRIIRKLAHYFSPQRQTKVLNEGYATFCHYYIVNRMYDKGLLDAGSMMEFYALHSNVIHQPQHSRQFNPYKLGFSILMDIKRICENPTEEDKRWFPNLIGKDWVEQVNYAMMNFKDETFILQYLSPKVIRDMQIFVFNDPGLHSDVFEVTAISSDRDIQKVRESLANHYISQNFFPDVQITAHDNTGTRQLIITHKPYKDRPLGSEDAKKVLGHIADLWEYTVALETIVYDEQTAEAVAHTHLAHGKYSARA